MSLDYGTAIQQKSASMKPFEDTVATRHQYAREWKERNGKAVAGYLCTYVPEEILDAAGMLPVRVLPGHEPQDVTEAYVFSMFCPYSRDVLGQGLLGRYSYLDGLVYAHCCPSMRQVFESWRTNVSVAFDHLLWVPGKPLGKSDHSFFLSQVNDFKAAVEAWTKAVISEDDLRAAVEKYNLNRRLFGQLYELRRSDPPMVSGADTMQIVLAAMVMDKADHNPLLEQFLSAPREPARGGIRLMLLGSECDDVELVRLIEDLGGAVVVEDNCVGNRYWEGEVAMDDGVLSGLTTRYLHKLPCPIKDIDERRRPQLLLNLARQYQTQGAVFVRQKFCDPYVYDVYAVKKLFESEGLRTLTLELDMTAPYGVFRTRIEAFMEMFE